MWVLILNCGLKKSSEPSDTQVLADFVADGLVEHGVMVESVRVA